MLKIHHVPHLSLPHLAGSTHPMALSPVASDQDELIQAIDTEAHADEWQLVDNDSEQLTEFWNGVSDDIAHDPEWFTFAED